MGHYYYAVLPEQKLLVRVGRSHQDMFTPIPNLTEDVEQGLDKLEIFKGKKIADLTSLDIEDASAVAKAIDWASDWALDLFPSCVSFLFRGLAKEIVPEERIPEYFGYTVLDW